MQEQNCKSPGVCPGGGVMVTGRIEPCIKNSSYPLDYFSEFSTYLSLTFFCLFSGGRLPIDFPASRGPFFFVFAELTDGTKRDLCHGSK